MVNKVVYILKALLFVSNIIASPKMGINERMDGRTEEQLTLKHIASPRICHAEGYNGIVPLL